jgi:hypothetical protein
MDDREALCCSTAGIDICFEDWFRREDEASVDVAARRLAIAGESLAEA